MATDDSDLKPRIIREWHQSMNGHGSLRVAIVSDLDESIEKLLLHLTATEREQAKALPTVRRIRQYVIGRLAARKAIRELLEDRMCVSSIEILSELDQAPFVNINGEMDQVRISISHSSRLAVACAWLAHSSHLGSAGIDLEYVRSNEVVESYAFSRAERKLLFQAPEGPEITALAAWTVKESVWKALLADQAIGPNAIEIRRQSLAQGRAAVSVKGQLAKRLGHSNLKVQMGKIEGPDGTYVFSLTQVVPPTAHKLRELVN
jgi:phosphopantetheinyl transferase (holo-ACP synthase)